ncbi:MAG: ABC transporter ATP-binding protein [Alphaproteobacteria bacterium]|nr:ABC transporter ATP-binding protein [Alphaproteobacteria bacterium]
MSLLEVRGLTRDFGGLRALDDLGYAVARGPIHAVIGPNGAGKTTLFNLIAGIYVPTAGRILIDGQDVTALPTWRRARLGLARSFQNLQLFENMSGLDNVRTGLHRHEPASLLGAMLAWPAIRRAERAGRKRAEELLAFVGLEAWAEVMAEAMPYGVLKRLEIARALASEPRLLMLDEPAAGLNATEKGEIDGLIRKVAAAGTTVVLVEHDMKLVMNLAERILVLDHGRRLAEGTPAEVRADPAVARAYLGTGHAA